MNKLQKKAGIQLSVNFLVMLIIAIVVFGSSMYMIKKFFMQADTIKMTYDERTEKEIERLLDDGSKVAIPFDKKIIGNGEFKTFGIGVLNVLNTGVSNDFEITVSFGKAFNKLNTEICTVSNPCIPSPNTWLQTTSGTMPIQKSVKNNEQEKFLLGVGVNNAPQGTYIFNLIVCVDDTDTTNDVDSSGNDVSSDCPNSGSYPDRYDTVHKLYVEVP